MQSIFSRKRTSRGSGLSQNVVRSKARESPAMVQLEKLACGGVLLALGAHFVLNTDRFVVGAALIAVALLILASGSRRPLRLPPGPRGIPVLGYLPFLTEMPHKHMAELAQKYGPLVHFRLGATPAIIVASPAMMREVLGAQDQIFSARPPALLSSKYFAYTPDELGRSHGCTAAQLGPYFRNVRRLYSTEMVSPKRLNFFKASRAEEMQIMVSTIWEASHGGRQPVELRRFAFIPMANNITTYMICHKRYHGPEQVKEGQEVQSLINQVTRMLVNVSLANFFPILRPFTQFSTEERKMAAVGKRVDAYLQSLLDEGRANPLKDESEKTIIDVVLGFQRDDGTEIDDRTRKCLVLEMLLAGTESTATMVEWAMAELLRHPEVLKKLQRELDVVVGTSRFVEEDDMPNLPYLTAIFHETSRLHPVSPLLFPHECAQATQIDGYDIPAGARVFLNTWAMGRDPKTWARPEEFDPERFTDDTNVDHKGKSFKILPFGAGRRICAGMPLGYCLVKLALAHIVQSFEWTFPEGMNPKDISIEENFGVALTMQHPLRSYLLKPRLPLHLYARN
ncbi:hypothetical protein KC19_2G166900 [Ceratodon purpureus]|uniref:Cytochrome P450 n=1 Tax=Ceratodon purpureus TaxID=3225 RepID=A0A8T0IUQ6_CERPU|nr:hypothetical protein KC19_2G166900 [Ceratodon purpureus]